ncbi:hypothetical protein IEQ34_004098 [Dendrobium chrysotoxum]|uniref:BAH domain-containing protein n=1 Tax=Dendrobium chrysotoxum TaxID=161865 RepID=A0AAV7GYH2_DENCH|nr:hypothetical protein IEQ34_004098 [Dendrobium chrysotoxum]
MDSEFKGWVRWEEEIVSNDRGRREVHYYVRAAGGGRDLAVVGREKSARHMAYAVPAKFYQSLICLSDTASPSGVNSAAAALPSDLKLRTRRQVVDWLSLLVSDSTPYGLAPVLDRYSDDEDASPASIPVSKVLSSGRMRHHSEEFSWLGSAWSCKKRRKHYQSFCRNGITISVHDFIYVLSEDNKRLVAYIEDLYEDVRVNNMVAVRWFHKVDEISIVLPPDTNDREIFFSLCLQDFSVECVDGLAAVLGFEDFDKFQKEALHRYSSWDPFLCRRQIGQEEVKPFDVTQVQGYWGQDLLRSMYPSCFKLRLKIKGHGSSVDGNKNSFDFQGNCKRKPHSNSGGVDVEGLINDIDKSKVLSVGNRLERHDRVKSSAALFRRGLVKQVDSQQQNLITSGLGIEVLSQDSGIRGCWFCCVVLKRHRDRIKVQYRDVEDADGTGNLEEWVSTSRIATTDKLGIRISGRRIVRPSPPKKDESLCSYEVGKVVDAWWHDGWWEGIVISNDSEGKIHVYFPGEQQVSSFRSADLRPSQDWVENKWNYIKARPDIATLLLSELDHEKCSDCVTFQASPSVVQTEAAPRQEKGDRSPPFGRAETCRSQLGRNPLLEKRERNESDLVRSYFHDGLRWSSSRKRTHARQLAKKFLSSKRRRIDFSHKCSDKSSTFLIPKSLKVVEQDN